MTSRKTCYSQRIKNCLSFLIQEMVKLHCFLYLSGRNSIYSGRHLLQVPWILESFFNAFKVNDIFLHTSDFWTTDYCDTVKFLGPGFQLGLTNSWLCLGFKNLSHICNFDSFYGLTCITVTFTHSLLCQLAVWFAFICFSVLSYIAFVSVLHM